MRSNMNAIVQVEGLRKVYGATVAVEDVSFEVRQGEIFGMVGPNGAGKTTTIECLEGASRPTRAGGKTQCALRQTVRRAEAAPVHRPGPPSGPSVGLPGRADH